MFERHYSQNIGKGKTDLTTKVYYDYKVTISKTKNKSIAM